jgi:hypothetical protein
VQRQLIIRTEESREITIPYTIEQVNTTLRNEGVTFGILPEAVRQAVTSLKEQNIIVAQGSEPVPGEDETVQEYFSHSVKRNQNADNTDGIYFYNHQVISQSKLGDLLAQIKPGRPGKPGQTVTGKEIPAPPIKFVQLHAKNGVRVVDGKKVFSVDHGRPMVEGNMIRFYNVVKQHYQNKDVTKKTGDIHFNGDLIINGNVFESATVTATGNITINGDAYSANIQAGQGVYIQGAAIGSTINASGSTTVFNKATAIFDQLHTVVTNIFKKLTLFQEKTGIMEQDKLGKIFLFIIERDFPSLMEAVLGVELFLNTESKSAIDIPPLITELVQKLSKGLSHLRECPHCSLFEVMGFMKTVGLLMDYFQKGHAPQADIVLKTVHHCQIQTADDVTVEECYHSNINAAFIFVNSIVRGGTLFAGEGISVKEAGSPFGIKTTLRVPREKRITANLAHENTVIDIGGSIYRLTAEKSRVTFLSSDGHIMELYEDYAESGTPRR